MKKILLPLFLVLMTTPILFAKKQKSKVIAKVNGNVIYQEEFDQKFKEAKLHVSTKVVTKKGVLQDIINRKVGISKAKKTKIAKDPVVKYKLESVMYHAQISKDLEGPLQKITVSDSEVKSYYKSHPEYRTAQILFRLRAIPRTPKDSEASLKLCLNIYSVLKKDPNQFAQMANKYSQSTSAPNGGDMGFLPAVQFAPEFFKAINGKKLGSIVSCIETQFGFHIVKMLAKKEYKEINLGLYKKIVYDVKRDKILNDYFARERKTAKIEVLDKSFK